MSVGRRTIWDTAQQEGRTLGRRRYPAPALASVTCITALPYPMSVPITALPYAMSVPGIA
eukprot:3473275-Rhodomonas_salina.1